MKSVSWWQWLCIGLLVAACSLVTTGCDDDDGDDDAEATPTPAVDDGDDDGGDDDGDSTPQAQSEVLWDSNMALSFRDTRDFVAEVPADGTVAITASWTAIDLIAGGAPVDIPIQFRVNHGMLADHNSPYSWSGTMSGGEFCEMVVKNNVTDTRATVHVRAVFTPD